MTWRTVALSAVFMWLAGLWIQQAALVTLSAQVGMAVPPVPAIAALLVLLGWRTFNSRLPSWLRLSRAEILLVYVILCFAVAMCSGGAIRFFLPSLMVAPYFASPENGLARIAACFPSWYAPHGAEVIRQYFEGSETGGVPWAAWWPLLGWTVVFLAFFGGTLCLCVLLRRSWMEDERLSFPLVSIPEQLAGAVKQTVARPPFMRDPLMWTGFALVAVHNGLNMLKSLNPTVPALPQVISLQPFLTEGPLRGIWWLAVRIEPMVLGLGYLMPNDTLLTACVFFLFILVQWIGFNMIGYNKPGVPYNLEQTSGAYVGIALTLLWLGRRRWRESLQAAFSRSAAPDRQAERWAWWGLVGCTLIVFAWYRAAGMSTATWLVFFGLVGAFMLAFLRIRAESGLPSMWCHPLNQAIYLPLRFVGTAPFAPGGDFRNLAILSSCSFYTRGYFPYLSSYQLEGLKLARDSNIRLRSLVAGLMFAVALGSAVGFWLHLSAYYHFGGNVLEGGTTEGGYRIQLYLKQYTDLDAWQKTPLTPDRNRAAAAVFGLLVAVVTVALRYQFLRFPLNPAGIGIGYVRATQSWAMLTLVYVIKLVILKVGGIKLYQRVLPLFLGIALGHLVTAGLVWGLLSTFGGEAFRNYVVWF